MNSQRKFLSISFKVLAVLSVLVLSLSSLFALSVSAADEIAAIPKTSITVVASIDTINGSMPIGNAEIKVYKVTGEDQLKKENIKKETLLTTAVTGPEGEVKLTLTSGYYIFQESEVVFNNKRYTAEPIFAHLSKLTDGKKVYVKHTVTDIPTSEQPTTSPAPTELPTVLPTEAPTTVYNEPQEKPPFTGSQTISSVIAAAVMAAGFAVMLKNRKKEED